MASPLATHSRVPAGHFSKNQNHWRHRGSGTRCRGHACSIYSTLHLG